jgi:ubiquinone/menaquinone biosynthesis C-methylase UbiE
VPDAIFADPRLAELYDVLDADRSDLDVYVNLIDELGARRVLDVGCGTGSLACLLVGRGLEVIAVDPAAASLELARRKPIADRVTWVHADAARVPAVDADLAIMTGNVAQVFLTDDDWDTALRAIHTALRPDGTLVFEVRDPAQRAWQGWTRQATERQLRHPVAGWLTAWTQLTDVSPPYVSFRQIVRINDGDELVSDSTLRFRDRQEVADSLERAGFALLETRDAPDRPGLEFVFVTRRRDPGPGEGSPC